MALQALQTEWGARERMAAGEQAGLTERAGIESEWRVQGYRSAEEEARIQWGAWEKVGMADAKQRRDAAWWKLLDAREQREADWYQGHVDYWDNRYREAAELEGVRYKATAEKEADIGVAEAYAGAERYVADVGLDQTEIETLGDLEGSYIDAAIEASKIMTGANIDWVNALGPHLSAAWLTPGTAEEKIQGSRAMIGLLGEVMQTQPGVFEGSTAQLAQTLLSAAEQTAQKRDDLLTRSFRRRTGQEQIPVAAEPVLPVPGAGRGESQRFFGEEQPKPRRRRGLGLEPPGRLSPLGR